MSAPPIPASVVLPTARLELAPPRAEDLPGLVALVAPEAMQRHLAPGVDTGKAQFERLLRNAGSWALHGYGMFMVRRTGEPRIIGTCGVFRSFRGFGHGMDDVAEAGWIIAEDHWGKGLAGEAMSAVLDWFDTAHGSTPLKCMIAEGNAASHHLAARLSFAEYDRVSEEGTELVLYQRAGLPLRLEAEAI